MTEILLVTPFVLGPLLLIFSYVILLFDSRKSTPKIKIWPFVLSFLFLEAILIDGRSIEYSESIPRPIYDLFAALKYSLWPYTISLVLQAFLVIAIYVFSQKKLWPLISATVFSVSGLFLSAFAYFITALAVKMN